MPVPQETGEIEDIATLIQAILGPPQPEEPPEHWFDMDVQLQHVQGSVVGTVPSFMCDEAGVNRDDPPEVTVYYDPHTGLAFYDLAGYFE